MNRKRICIWLAILFSTSAYAQNVEIGLAGGISYNSNPSDNMVYKTDKSAMNYAGAVTVLYNFAEHMQYGLQAHVLGLSGTSSTIYPDVNNNNNPIGGDDKRFVYAKNDALVCGVFNGRLDVGRGYVYAGIALGYGISRQSSTTLSSNEAYRAPDGGNGLVFGGQLGYIVGINHRIGAYIEAAYRYIDLKYDAQAPGVHPATDLYYHLSALPVIIGIRYRILNTIMDNGFQQEKGSRYSRNKK